MDQPRWLAHAWAEYATAARPGAANAPRVVRFFADVGHPEIANDETAWCAAFAGACLERAGLASTRSLLARSYLAWGTPLQEARTGAIAILSRGADPALGHVAFLIGETATEIMLLGGNQGRAVTVSAFPRTRLLDLRWPATAIAAEAPAVAGPQPIRASSSEDALFARAFEHVLSMEGGYGEDPYDPGGPTNLGITLAEFARTRGVPLSDATYAGLKAALRAITREEAGRIYRADYWNAASCPDLPAPLAVFHFDAAVNQGVHAAARFLQQALGVGVDGVIGPITRAAAREGAPLAHLAAYAEARRAHYRSLSTFWRFGRGWLSRVDTTLKVANAVADDPLFNQPNPNPNPKEPSMSDTPATANPPAPTSSSGAKWWGNSVTIWGVLVTALSTVLPALGPVLGLNLTAELIQQLGGNVVQLVQAAGGLIGTALAIWGRVRATTPIERRQFMLKV